MKRSQNFFKAATLILLVTFAAGVARGQDPQAYTPRKADAQFHRDYQRAKKINARITDATSRAAAKLNHETREDRLTLEGLSDELQAEMRGACADVPQGCRYDEAMDVFIPLPPRASAPQQAQLPAAKSAPAPKEEKK